MSLKSLDKYGDDFQNKIVYYLVADRKFFMRVIDILDPEFFGADRYSEIIGIIKEWNKKYRTVPTFENLRSIINVDYGNEEDSIERDFLLELIDEVSKEKDPSDKKFVQDRTLAFCKQRAMENAILKSARIVKEDGLPDEEKFEMVVKVVKDAMHAGEDQNIGHALASDVMIRTAQKRNPVATGFELLDKKYMAMGLSGGEIGIILGGTGVGKSFVLGSMAKNAFCNGKTSVVYSFEMREYPFGFRLDSGFSKIPLTKLLLDFDGVYRDRVAKAIEAERSKHEKRPDIIIKEYPVKTATIEMMKSHYDHIVSIGIKPDVIFVDYADLVKPTHRHREKRFELESIIEELRAWSLEVDVPIWTASQTNREGIDTSVVTLKMMSEALSKAMAADFVLGVGRTPEMESNNRACYYIAKNRLGKKNVAFMGNFNTDIMDITIDTEGVEEEIRGEERQNLMNSAVDKVLKKSGSSRSSETLRSIISELE